MLNTILHLLIFYIKHVIDIVKFIFFYYVCVVIN
nr:MAG TPA: hypothetical protein [Microviridae sp.]